MTKKQKKNLIVKTIALGFGKAVIIFACAVAIISMFALAYLQESYRLNPPSQAERAEHPALTKFLIGSDSETADNSNPLRSIPFHSPLFGIKGGWRKPNELCRVTALLQMRRYR